MSETTPVDTIEVRVAAVVAHGSPPRTSGAMPQSAAPAGAPRAAQSAFKGGVVIDTMVLSGEIQLTSQFRPPRVAVRLLKSEVPARATRSKCVAPETVAASVEPPPAARAAPIIDASAFIADEHCVKKGDRHKSVDVFAPDTMRDAQEAERSVGAPPDAARVLTFERVSNQPLAIELPTPARDEKRPRVTLLSTIIASRSGQEEGIAIHAAVSVVEAR